MGAGPVRHRDQPRHLRRWLADHAHPRPPDHPPRPARRASPPRPRPRPSCTSRASASARRSRRRTPSPPRSWASAPPSGCPRCAGASPSNIVAAWVLTFPGAGIAAAAAYRRHPPLPLTTRSSVSTLAPSARRDPARQTAPRPVSGSRRVSPSRTPARVGLRRRTAPLRVLRATVCGAQPPDAGADRSTVGGARPGRASGRSGRGSVGPALTRCRSAGRPAHPGPHRTTSSPRPRSGPRGRLARRTAAAAVLAAGPSRQVARRGTSPGPSASPTTPARATTVDPYRRSGPVRRRTDTCGTPGSGTPSCHSRLNERLQPGLPQRVDQRHDVVGARGCRANGAAGAGARAQLGRPSSARRRTAASATATASGSAARAGSRRRSAPASSRQAGPLRDVVGRQGARCATGRRRRARALVRGCRSVVSDDEPRRSRAASAGRQQGAHCGGSRPRPVGPTRGGHEQQVLAAGVGVETRPGRHVGAAGRRTRSPRRTPRARTSAVRPAEAAAAVVKGWPSGLTAATRSSTRRLCAARPAGDQARRCGLWRAGPPNAAWGQPAAQDPLRARQSANGTPRGPQMPSSWHEVGLNRREPGSAEAAGDVVLGGPLVGVAEDLVGVVRSRSAGRACRSPRG